ncbi:MAG: hypothetical protein H8D78_19720, partial [Chloroflexi bacterium]|nr:hypothetical protein [Chloroflexota bacterium]
NLKYATAAPWLNWSDDLECLLLPPRGATVGLVYENVPLPATLTATLSGPALFADGSQQIAVDIINPDGSHTFRLKPAAGAALGNAFTLEVTLAGQRLRRSGTIAAELYLPLVHRE